jgi:hypothetical protein
MVASAAEAKDFADLGASAFIISGPDAARRRAEFCGVQKPSTN